MDTVQRMADLADIHLITDSGYLGKNFEIVIREYIQPNSRRNNEKITKANTSYGDLRIRTKNGKYLKIEVKTSCGELAILNEEIDLEENELSDYILPKADLVIYCPTIDIKYPLEKQSYVFTRDAFIAMINNYNGSGKILRIKETTNGKTAISFQSFYAPTRLKASKKIAEYLIDNCICQPTVEEFFNK